jgi:SAM-dependent methyltransferase
VNGSSIALFDELAPDYDSHFQVPHRAAYDALAWEASEEVLGRRHATVVDAGCGSGRWGARLVASGHHVIGIEQSPRMAAAARERHLGDGFELVEGGIEDVVLDIRADVVLAMGSLQYTEDPEATICRLAAWTAPGGNVIVLVDSLIALVLELLRAGRRPEALERLHTHRGVWRAAGHAVEHHLLDAERLRRAFALAGLLDVSVRGLLVGASTLGKEQLTEALAADFDAALGRERELASEPLLADLGKQLLAIGRAPG